MICSSFSFYSLPRSPEVELTKLFFELFNLVSEVVMNFLSRNIFASMYRNNLSGFISCLYYIKI